MDVFISEPISPVTLYEFSREPMIYQRDELGRLLDDIEGCLDKSCRKMRSGEYALADYTIDVLRVEPQEFLGDILRGGFIIDQERGFVSVNSFRSRYKKSFRKIRRLEEVDFRIGIDVLIVGFRDKIMHKVEAREPY